MTTFRQAQGWPTDEQQGNWQQGNGQQNVRAPIFHDNDDPYEVFGEDDDDIETEEEDEED